LAASDMSGCSVKQSGRNEQELTMERKGGNTTLAVTADEVRAALSKARTVTTEEEKALRMRHGATVDKSAPLPSAAEGNPELEDELMLIEMQLMKAWKRRLGEMKLAQPVMATRNAPKERIIRGLRKKK
jgi:hypothetical protein